MKFSTAYVPQKHDRYLSGRSAWKSVGVGIPDIGDTSFVSVELQADVSSRRNRLFVCHGFNMGPKLSWMFTTTMAASVPYTLMSCSETSRTVPCFSYPVILLLELVVYFRRFGIPVGIEASFKHQRRLSNIEIRQMK